MLKVTHTRTEKFNCSLERAFKTPILGDATKILVGYGGIPPIIDFANDQTWGIVGGSRIPIRGANLFLKSKPQGFDEIIYREENKYWKWRVSNLGLTLFFASEAVGEWWVRDNNDGTISAKWTYTWFAKNILTYPLTYLFIKVLWRGVMKKGIANIKQMAEMEMPYIYDK